MITGQVSAVGEGNCRITLESGQSFVLPESELPAQNRRIGSKVTIMLDGADNIRLAINELLHIA